MANLPAPVHSQWHHREKAPTVVRGKMQRRRGFSKGAIIELVSIRGCCKTRG